LGSVVVRAQDSLSIVKSSAQPQFPAMLVFSLEARSAVNITDVRLHYIIERDSFARVVTEIKPVFTPAASVSVSWSWDMRQSGGLPPSSIVEYWWTLADSSGKRLTSTTQQVSFDDTRYSWRSLKQGNITLYWYSGDNAFASEIMTSAQQGLARVEKDTGAHLSQPVKVYIYASTQDLQGGMIFPQEWTGGAAYTPYNTIVIGIGQANLDWGKRSIVHELTHLVTYQMTRNPYSGLPNWLVEGLSMYSEGDLEAYYKPYLITSIAQNRLISVRSLASSFSTDPSQSYLAYAQSYSLVDFLVTTYGQPRMLELLNTFQQGSDYDAALLKVYGFDMDGLDSLWRAYATQKYLATKTGVTA
jgi:hypothetical protein